MDYTEALMNLIMVLGFVLVFSPKTSYIYANTTEKHQKFYRGIGIILAVWAVMISSGSSTAYFGRIS